MLYIAACIVTWLIDLGKKILMSNQDDNGSMKLGLKSKQHNNYQTYFYNECT